ncbi:MAG: TolC family protein [Kiritimatiellae bacterium]|nr:TolC family protein [Kiritimatiellia bacterium]MDW8457678.1 TolC family protein [Verrucomicrobiota bacterium]
MISCRSVTYTRITSFSRHTPIMKFACLIGFAHWFLATASLRAETARAVGWEEFCLEVAARNAALEAARERAEQARRLVDEAAARFWPSLSVSADRSRSESDGGTTDRTSAGLSAQYALYAGGSDRARWLQARANADVSEAELAAARSLVGAEARSAFVRLLFAQERAALAEKISERRRQNFELVRLRFEAGAENKGSLLRVEAALRRAEAEVREAKRDIPVRQRELSALAGYDDPVAWVAVGSLEAPEPPDESDWGPLVRSVPAVRAAAARAEAASAAAALARGERRPEISLQANLQREGEGDRLDQEGWSIGAAVSIPLFTGGGLPARYAAAEAAARAARAEADQALRTAAAELERARADLMNALDQVEVLRAFRAAAEIRAEIARAQYANGLLSFQTWDQIEDELIQSEQNLLAQLRDAALAAAEWDRARGVSPLPEAP